MNNILNPQFISIPPKPKDEDYKSLTMYLSEKIGWQKTYYPLDYLLEHGMTGFEDKLPKHGQTIIYKSPPLVTPVFQRMSWEDNCIYWLEGDVWVDATEYDQAKEKQEQYGRLRGEWVLEEGCNQTFYNEKLDLRLGLSDVLETWWINRGDSFQIFLCRKQYCTYEMVNNFLEMYEKGGSDE